MSTGLAVVRGAGIATVAGVLALAAASILNVAEVDAGWVYLIGVAAAGVVGLAPRGRREAEIGGVAAVGLFAFSAGAVTGFGLLEYSLIIGSVLAAVWVVTGERGFARPARWFAWGGILIPLLVFILLPLVVDGKTLGHDESAYALKARQWLEGTPGTGWSVHRGIAMSLYGYAVLSFGGSEPALRAIGLAGAVGLVAAVWSLGRALIGPVVGAMAAAGVIAGPAFLQRSTEYLSDVPSAPLLVFCMLVVWRQFHDRPLPTYGLLWVLPLAWTAFYLRYQSALSLALIAAVTLALWWPKIRERPGPVVALVGLGIIGLIPHFLQAIASTGNPLGILTTTSSGAVRAYLGEGLVDYLGQARWHLAGYVGPVAFVATVVGAVAAWPHRDRRRRYLFLLAPALAQVSALGLISHGEPRFLFFPIALVMVAGATSLHAALVGGSRWGRAAVWATTMIMIGSLALSVSSARRAVDIRIASNEPVELASDAVVEVSDATSCGVLTSYSPQVTFYSGCATRTFPADEAPQEVVDGLAGDSRFMILIDNGKNQPSGPELGGYLDLTDGLPMFVDGDRRDATVVRFVG